MTKSANDNPPGKPSADMIAAAALGLTEGRFYKLNDDLCDIVFGLVQTWDGHEYPGDVFELSNAGARLIVDALIKHKLKGQNESKSKRSG